MHLFKALKYRLEVGDGILNRPLSLHQRPFDEQASTVSSGSKAGGFGSPDICDFIKSDQPAMFPPVGIRLAMPA